MKRKKKKPHWKQDHSNVIVVRKRNPRRNMTMTNRKLTPSHMNLIQADLKRLIPKKMPYKVGLHHQLFNKLKNRYPNSHAALKVGIKTHLYYLTGSIKYHYAMLKEKNRYGLYNKKYPLTRRDKFESRKKLSVIHQKMRQKKVA